MREAAGAGQAELDALEKLTVVFSPASDYFSAYLGEYRNVLSALETLNSAVLAAMDKTKLVRVGLWEGGGTGGCVTEAMVLFSRSLSAKLGCQRQRAWHLPDRRGCPCWLCLSPCAARAAAAQPAVPSEDRELCGGGGGGLS